MKNLKIILVDDHKVYRSALKGLLQSKFKYWIIDEAGNAEELMKLKDFQKADLILMDIKMSRRYSIELTKKLLRDYPDLKIVANTLYIENLYLTTLLEAGFKGCILKLNLLENIEECFSKVLGGELYFPEKLNLSISNSHQFTRNSKKYKQ